MLRLIALLSVLLAANAAWAMRCTNLATLFNTTDFSCNSGTGIYVLGPNVTELGSCIGKSTDFCNQGQGGVNMGGTPVQVQQGTATTGTDCDASGEAGRIFVDTDAPDGFALATCPGASGWVQRGPETVLGGTGADSDFAYNGEDTSTSSHLCAANGGTANICRGGTCTGTYPNGTCIITANSMLGRTGNLDGTAAAPSVPTTTLYSCIKNYTSFALTSVSAGTPTVTCGAAGAFANGAGAPSFGAVLELRIKGNYTQSSSSVIDMAGKGAAGGATTSCGNKAGGAGGGNSFVAVSSAAAAGKSDGVVGVDAVDPVGFPLTHIWGVGSGGGALATAAFATTAFYPYTVYAGTGASSAACQTGCSGTSGAGGRGGGYIVIEVGGAYSNAGTITVAGSAGSAGTTAAGGSGGGGGMVRVTYRDLTSNSATCTKTGGAAGTNNDATNCGAAKAGGAGICLVGAAPR